MGRFFTDDCLAVRLVQRQAASPSRRTTGLPQAGQVVGMSPKNEDIAVNVCKKKQLTNTRASGSDDALRLIPPRRFSLEESLEFLSDDELLEVTPKSIRIRKKVLDHAQRMREQMKKKS